MATPLGQPSGKDAILETNATPHLPRLGKEEVRHQGKRLEGFTLSWSVVETCDVIRKSDFGL